MLKAMLAAPVEHETVVFSGGLDLVSSPLLTPLGRALEAQNFDVSLKGGYRRPYGYERLDGRPKPSDARYAVLSVTITGSFAVGNTITGVTSAATAAVIAVVTSVSPNYLVVTKIVGTFVSSETLNVAAAPQGTTSSAAIVDGASTTLLHAQYKNLAADNYRADILAVPGSGNVLGVIHHNDIFFAFRNNAGGTAAALYKSSASGWVLVDLGEEISFTLGSGDVDEGDVLTQGAVTATVKRVVLISGTFAGGTAAGRLILSARAGGNYAAGAATTTGAGALTLSGIQTAITLNPSGRYEFVKENFGGAPNTKRVYGVDGKNRGFEFDGTTYTPITTGMTTDTPEHVWAHKKHLFFSFIGSVQHAAPGTPYVWSPITGAAEIGMGDQVTGFASQPGSADGGALAIFTRNRLSVLYGSGVASWQLVPYRDELGAFAYTIQDVGYTMFFDDRGITNLQTAQVYGNFAHGTITSDIQPFINEKRTKALASCISRDNSQYRIFFSDKYALYITAIGKKIIGIMPQVFNDTVRCVYSGEMADGSEVIAFGSDDGFVFQMDKGTSFDGDDIEAYFSLPFNFSKSPRTLKHYRQGMFEITGNGYATFNFSFDLGYANTDIPIDAVQSIVTSFSAGKWDTGSFDIGVWDGRTLMPASFDLHGDAENISLRVISGTDYYDPFIFHATIFDYSRRAAVR